MKTQRDCWQTNKYRHYLSVIHLSINFRWWCWMKWNVLLLHSSRKRSLICLMVLVSLNYLLTNIEGIITSFTPYSKHFFPMSIIPFGMSFASILLILLCITSFEPSWIITISGQSCSKTGVMKWSSLLMVASLKLFKCALLSFIELLNKFFLIIRIWLSPTMHIVLPCFVILAYDRLPVFIEFLLCVLISFAFIATDGWMLCGLFFSAF